MQLALRCIQTTAGPVECDVVVHGGSANEAMLDLNWRLARRVASATAGLGTALALALHVFVGVAAGPLVLATAVAALCVGSRLPAASPRHSLLRLRRLLAV